MSKSVIYSVMLVFGAIASACAGDAPVPERTPGERIAERGFPSIFQAWNPADNLKEDAQVTVARHDLVFNGESFFGLQWDNVHSGLATNFTQASLSKARVRRHDMLARNPNLVLLMEIRYRDAHGSFLPDGHKWWRRDNTGKIVYGWEEGGYLQLDFSNAEYREQVAMQAQAAVESKVVDGVMLDWWLDDDDRLLLVKAIRNHIGENALILANANDRTTPRTAPFINGYFMECYRSQTADDWRRIAETLTWAEKNLRAPRVNCLETWYHKSRTDEHLMRATTTLSLVLSDGYCLFSDPNPLPTPDHLHNWYPFWERRLGKAQGQGVARSDGALAREFAHGAAVYNPMGNKTVQVNFDEPRTSSATGKRERVHTLDSCDGDLFLKDDAVKTE